MNKVLKFLILSDFFFWTALGFVGPILAIYINDDISGGTLGLTGLAMALFWIVKSMTALVTSKYTDKEPGNQRELAVLFIGSLIVIFIPIGYLLAQTIWQIIAIQVVFGLGAGLAFPGWMTIFTRFLDKGHEGFDWSMDSASIDFGNGLAIGLSGFVAEFLGFNVLFIFSLILNIVSFVMVIWLFKYKKEILRRF